METEERRKNNDLVYCLSNPREMCETCYNWLTQEDVGSNDLPQCSENKQSCRDYLFGYSDTCPYHIEL